MKSEALVDTISDTLSEVVAKTIADTLTFVEPKAPVIIVGDTVAEVEA